MSKTNTILSTALPLIAAVCLMASGCSSTESTEAAAAKTETAATDGKAAPATPPAAQPTPPADPAPKADPNNPKVLMETNRGNIELELFQEKAPISTANFIAYIKDGAYNGTVFHRVISNFMIQGGGFDKDLQKRETKAPIANESNNGVKNLRGTISMARTNAPDSATNQFFINVKDNPNLDFRGRPGYAVFGRVTKGMDVVDAIRNVATGSCPPMFQTDCPKEPVIITKVSMQ